MSSNFLNLSQRTGGRRGGSMSVGATNATAKDYNNVKEFPQQFNMSQGGSVKTKKVKKVLKGGSVIDASEVEGGAVKKPKTKRVPSKYNAFVKANYAKSKHLPAKERLKYIAGLWREHSTK